MTLMTLLKKHTVIAYLLFCCTTLVPQKIFAQTSYIPVGEAKLKKTSLGISTKSQGAASPHVALIQSTLEADYTFLDLFKIYPASQFPQTTLQKTEDLQYSLWKKTGLDYLTWLNAVPEGGSRIAVEAYVFSFASEKPIFGKRYRVDTSEVKTLARTIGDDIIQAITGKKGILNTRIAMVCSKSGKKEIYTTAFDGSDIKQITHLRSLTQGPAWSPDGKKIAFSVINRHANNIKNIDLYELSLATHQLNLLSNRTGINSGANYSPDGKELALTMSFNGNPDIYILNLETKQARAFTKSLGFDVDPKFSPDGKSIAFVSSRPGKPMLYLASLTNPNNPKRLTYAGNYNATPSWSPEGKKIAFAGWLDGHFDLFTIHVATNQIDRLTKDEGNNEDPSYSPDGNYLVFSSNRSQGKNIWIMSTDASFSKRLTFNMGECVAPQWSPYLTP